MSENKQKTIGYQAPQYYDCRPFWELGPAFQNLAQVYKQKAAEAKPCWYEKYAAVYFMYEGKPYCMAPWHLETDDNRFACIEGELIDDLYALGAYEMFYSGMLD